MERESCIQCACKHIAQARVLLLEARKGYPEHYFFALGHLAEAEDELGKDYERLANLVRVDRKILEDQDDWITRQEPHWPDFSLLILRVAGEGNAEEEARIVAFEEDFEGRSHDELQKMWNEIQGNP